MAAPVRALLLLGLLLAPAALGAPRLHAVVPDLPGPGPLDEGLAVTDPEGAWDLAGWSLRDGEGVWTFPSASAGAGEAVWVVGDAAAWAAHGGPDPTFTWTTGDGLALANAGETVCLHDPAGAAADCFGWGPGGEVTYRSPGAVYRRGDDGWVTPRIHRVGETALETPTFAAEAVTAYASPDSGLATWRTLIASARERLHLHLYDLRHPVLVDALVAAAEAHPDLDLQVLTDGRVVGHDAEDRAAVAWGLHRLRDAGAHVIQAEGGRYTHHHLKVLVADDAVAVQSENGVVSGLPLDPSWGNRGWGVVAHGPDLADWMAAWMREDRVAWDTVPFTADAPPPERRPVRMPAVTGENAPLAAARIEGPVPVIPLVAPDHTADPERDPLLARLQAATTRIWTQQLRLEVAESNRLGWQAPDRYAAALADAAARGVDVRVQLQGAFGARDDNAEAAAWLRERGVAVSRPDPPGIATLHNKGWIIDDAVVVGSMNGHHASRSANREVDLLVEDARVAAYFAALFLADAPAAEPTAPLPVSIPLSPLPILLATAGVARSLHRRP